MKHAEYINKIVYQGTTYRSATQIIVASDDYVLIKKKATTEYVDRFSGTTHSSTEWFVFDLVKDLDITKLSYYPKEVSEFHIEGKLLKKHKEEIESKFGLVYPKKERKEKSNLVDAWVVFYKTSDYYGSSAYEHCLNFGELVSINEKSLKVKDKTNKVRTLSKSMYYYTICNSDNVEEVYNDVIHKIDVLNDAAKKVRQAGNDFKESFKQNNDIVN